MRTPSISLKHRYEELLRGRKALLLANSRLAEQTLSTATIPLRNDFEIYAENARKAHEATVVMQELWREYGEAVHD